jgi:hypothetical protein
MPVQVLVGVVRGGVIWPDEPLTLPDGARVTVTADLEEKGLVAVDPDDVELIGLLNEEFRTGGIEEGRYTMFMRESSGS